MEQRPEAVPEAQQDAGRTAQPAEQHAPVTAEPKPGVAQGERRDEDRQPSGHRNPSRPTRWIFRPQGIMVLATVAMAGASVVSTIVTTMTLGKLSESLDVAREANTLNSQALKIAEDNRNLAKDSLKLARDSFEESKKGSAESNERAREALELARDSNKLTAASLDLNRRQQRAWIVPKIPGQFTLKPNAEIQVTIEARNSGKTPAFKAIVSALTFPVPGKPESIYDRKKLPSLVPATPESRVPALGVLFGGAVAPDDVLLVHLTLPPLDAAALQAVEQGRVTLAIWGAVSYTDQFDTQGQTLYCRMYQPRLRAFAFCPALADEAK